jgi:hypothetical protein
MNIIKYPELPGQHINIKYVYDMNILQKEKVQEESTTLKTKWEEVRQYKNTLSSYIEIAKMKRDLVCRPRKTSLSKEIEREKAIYGRNKSLSKIGNDLSAIIRKPLKWLKDGEVI